jgi:hypothetical protein
MIATISPAIRAARTKASRMSRRRRYVIAIAGALSVLVVAGLCRQSAPEQATFNAAREEQLRAQRSYDEQLRQDARDAATFLQLLGAAAQQQQRQPSQPQPQEQRMMMQCPYCKEKVAFGARKCPHCSTAFTTQQSFGGH